MRERKLIWWQKIIHLCNPVIHRLVLVYWFIVRPTAQGTRVVLTNNNNVLVVEHTYGPRAHMFPGGLVKLGEEPEKTALREIYEELGIHLDELASLGSFVFEKHYKRDVIHVFHANIGSRAVNPDPFEIKCAFWSSVEDMPQLSPSSRTIFSMYQQYAQRTQSL